MKDLMKRAKELAESGENFNDIFCRACGWIDSIAEFHPGNTYTAVEIKEFFEVLFEIKVGRYMKEQTNEQT